MTKKNSSVNEKIGKKRPLSYYKYKAAHPTVSVVLTSELKDALKEYKGNMSYGEAIKCLLSEKRPHPYIHLTCPRCGETVVLTSELENWEEIVAFLSKSFFNAYKHKCGKRRTE